MEGLGSIRLDIDGIIPGGTYGPEVVELGEFVRKGGGVRGTPLEEFAYEYDKLRG